MNRRVIPLLSEIRILLEPKTLERVSETKGASTLPLLESVRVDTGRGRRSKKRRLLVIGIKNAEVREA